MLYALVARLLLPLAWWGRLRVTGIEAVPASGPVLVVPDHDSRMDPVLLAIALRRRRTLRFLARGNLWRVPGLAPILNGFPRRPRVRIDLWPAPAEARTAAELLGAVRERVPPVPAGRSR